MNLVGRFISGEDVPISELIAACRRFAHRIWGERRVKAGRIRRRYLRPRVGALSIMCLLSLALPSLVAAAPPTCVEKVETGYNNSDDRTSASFDVVTDEILVVVAVMEGTYQTLSTPTGGSLTYTLQESIYEVDYTPIYLWTAPVDSNKSMTTTIVASGFSKWGFVVVGCTGSDGVGASEQDFADDSGAPSVAVTTTQADSAIVFGSGDWYAVNGLSRSYLTGPGTPTEHAYYYQNNIYTLYGATYPDVDSVGAKTVGVSTPTSQKWVIAAVEIKGSVAAAPCVTSLLLLGVGCR